jgi:hypothetical protein
LSDPLPPAQLVSEKAAQLGDLSLVLQDLRSVIDLCARLANELVKVEPDRDGLLIEALWTAALVKYVRCFTSGKRFGLDVSVFDGCSGANETHQYYKDMRDKHVAHSVNPFEGVAVGVLLEGELGQHTATGIVVLQHRLVCTDQSGVQTLQRLASVAQKNVRLRCKAMRDELLNWAKEQPTGTFKPDEISMTAPGPEQAGRPRGPNPAV